LFTEEGELPGSLMEITMIVAYFKSTGRHNQNGDLEAI
jgi:hypothetical protein